MLRRTHDKRVTELNKLIDEEYARATRDGCKKVRDWAVDASYTIFHADTSRQGPLAHASFQSAIGQFSPDRLVPRGGKK